MTTQQAIVGFNSNDFQNGAQEFADTFLGFLCRQLIISVLIREHKNEWALTAIWIHRVKDFQPQTNMQNGAEHPVHASKQMLPWGIAVIRHILGPSEARLARFARAQIMHGQIGPTPFATIIASTKHVQLKAKECRHSALGFQVFILAQFVQGGFDL